MSLLATAVMSADVQAVFFALAILCFIAQVIYEAVVAKALNLVALGLAFFVFVFFWQALAAA